MIKSMQISRRRLLGGAAGAAVAGLSCPVWAARSKTPVVVELFTSQGCSSCPPADAFMGELRQHANVIGLTLNVDYWDYLGWRDTLGSAEYSRRQRTYASERGDGQVYTPQMVINGHMHVVGSRRSDVLSAVEQEAGRMTRRTVPVAISGSGSDVVVDIGAAGVDAQSREATVWMVMVKDAIPIKIARGENTGREITYYNVARKFMPAGAWHGKALRLEYPEKELMAAGVSGCCVLLQVDGNGPVIGAADYGLKHGT